MKPTAHRACWSEVTALVGLKVQPCPGSAGVPRNGMPRSSRRRVGHETVASPCVEPSRSDGHCRVGVDKAAEVGVVEELGVVRALTAL
jgi:hypothetical protein